MGITLLLDFMAQGVRGVEHHRPLRVASGTMPPLGPSGPFTARVFKTVVDPYLGKVSMMRVLSGSLKQGQPLRDTTRDVDVRTAHLYVPVGTKLEEVPMLEAGMIGAVTKADPVRTADTLAAPGVDVVLAPIRVPSPVMALALTPRTRADDDKLSDGLAKLLDADPTLELVRDADTRETVLWGMGHVHLEVAVAELSERYGVQVDTRVPKVSYRETIAGPGDARYRHKKQSGGSGQFAEVALRVAPLPRGGVGIADRLVDRMHRIAGLDPFQSGGSLRAQRFGLSGVVGDVFEVADLLQCRVRRTAGDHRRCLLPCIAEGARRSRKFCGTVVSRLVLAAELRGRLPAGGVFGHDLLDLAVEAGGFELGVGLVEHVVVLLGEELPEPV
jgi:hypothetical protein